MAIDPWARAYQTLGDLGKTYNTQYERKRRAPLDALAMAKGQQALEEGDMRLDALKRQNQSLQDWQALQEKLSGQKEVTTPSAQTFGGYADGPYRPGAEVKSKRPYTEAEKRNASRDFLMKEGKIGEAMQMDQAAQQKFNFMTEAIVKYGPEMAANLISRTTGKPMNSPEMQAIRNAKITPTSDVIYAGETGQEIVGIFTPGKGYSAFPMAAPKGAGSTTSPDLPLEEWYDPETGKTWMRPYNKKLGKWAGPPITEVKDAGKKGSSAGLTGVVNKQATALVEDQKDAEGVISSISNLRTARNLMDEGMFTGTGAKVMAKVGNFLSERLGIDLAEDAAANTETYMSTIGNQVGQIIKQFGAGTGLSDADREYAEAIVGGKVQLTETALRHLLDINERAYKASLRQYLKKAEQADENIEKFGIPALYKFNMDNQVQHPNLVSSEGQIQSELLQAGDIVNGWEFKGWSFADPKLGANDRSAWREVGDNTEDRWW